MPIGRLTIELHIEHAQSLKDRRQAVRSLKDKLRHGFNISVAEMDDAGLWNRATIGVVAISASRDYVLGLLQQVEDAAHRLAPGLGAEILDASADLMEEQVAIEPQTGCPKYATLTWDIEHKLDPQFKLSALP